MASIPEKLQGYRKFINFIIKYWNSDLLQQAALSALEPIDAPASEEAKAQHYQKPRELVEDLKAMGPTYVKLGQLLSTRPDLIPDEYLAALSQLQDDVEEIPFEKVQSILEDELGVRLSKAFEEFEEKPLASASIGQVHRARLHSGKEVAVKVQRPGIRRRFLEDLDTLKEIVALAVHHSHTARKYALDELLEELRYILLNELDYQREARNLQLLGQNLRHYSQIIVPQPILDYTSPRVLTMDFVAGQKITGISPMRKTETDFIPLIDQLVEAYMQQIVIDGFAHADPHPGNVHLTADNRVILMDLGMVARFSRSIQEKLLKLLIAISQQDGEEICETLLEMSKYDEDADIETFKKNINRLVMDQQNYAARELKTGRLLIQMNRMAANEGIRIGVSLNILGKLLLNLDQIVASLTPEFDLQRSIRKHLDKLMQQKLVQELKPENLLSALVATKRLGKSLPERLNRISERLANNEFEIKIDALDEKRLTDGFQKVANRITLGLIIAAMIIGAAMLMQVPTSFTLLGYPGLAILFFLAAALAGFILIYNILFKDENFKRKV